MRVPAKSVRQHISLRWQLQYATRSYSTHPPSARLNTPIDYASHPLLHHTTSSLQSSFQYPKSSPSKRQNLFQAINSALSHALRTEEQTLIFGEDVAFGGVFRCTMSLLGEFGPGRVFNTPLSEQGIVGFAIGCAAQGMKPIAELQFADYVYPAFDQLVNEAAKWRYREGGTGGNVGGLVVRMPCGSVGHGALYHSQSPEALFTHIPGLRVVLPRSPAQAKGLLLASIACNDPVVFLEPKVLYRAAVEQVPTEAYEIPLCRAEIVKEGKDVTVVSYGQPLYLCYSAIAAAEEDLGISVELLDLRTLYPWDRETVLKSVQKTGRAIVVHESMINAGIGAEVAASIQEGAFLHLEAPVQRLGGWATHMGLTYERFILPDATHWGGKFEIAHDSYEENVRILEEAYAQIPRAYYKVEPANQQRLYEQYTKAADSEIKPPRAEAVITFYGKDRFEMMSGLKVFQPEHKPLQLKEYVEELITAVKTTIEEKECRYKSFLELDA